MRVGLLSSPLLLILTWVSAVAESLPQWSDEDFARSRRGEIIAGIDILVEDKEVMATLKLSLANEVLPSIPEEPAIIYDPNVVPTDALELYFSAFETHLIDPQQLLTSPEYSEQEGFLNYHAENSSLGIKMFIFDADQTLPRTHTIDKICQQLYSDDYLTVVVYCFLGSPDRTQLAFAGEGSENITSAKQREILETAKIRAMGKSEPVLQLDSFIVQLSISLFWLETDLKKLMAVIDAEQSRVQAATAWMSSKKSGEVDVIKVADGGGLEVLKNQWYWIMSALMGLLTVVVVCVLAIRMWRKSQRYIFPVGETPERLGARYAAGVGAVLIFHKKIGSPSKQRNQIPDYLRRI